MNDRLRIRDGLRGRRTVIEISPNTYKEVWDKLVEAGYDWLVWPDLGQIPMDGFVIRSAERNRQIDIAEKVMEEDSQLLSKLAE